MIIIYVWNWNNVGDRITLSWTEFHAFTARLEKVADPGFLKFYGIPSSTADSEKCEKYTRSIVCLLSVCDITKHQKTFSWLYSATMWLQNVDATREVLPFYLID